MRMAVLAALLVLACDERPPDPPAPATPAAPSAPARADEQPAAPNDPPTPCPVTDGYRGVVFGQPVFARLGVDGARVRGRYFYAKAGIDLSLEGTITTKNTIRLVEGDRGKSTGTFVGSCDAATGTLTGSWTGTKNQGDFRLEPVGPLDVPLVVTKRFAAKKRFLGPTTSGMMWCSYEETWPELFGLRDPDVERAMNGQGLDPKLGPIFEKTAATAVDECDGAFEESIGRTLTVQPHDFALVETSGWADFDGSAHPEDAIDYSRATVDLRTGKPVLAKDVFTRDATPAVLACVDGLAVNDLLASTWDQYLSGTQFDLAPDGVHFFGAGFPHAFSAYTGQGPTIPYGILLRDGFLRADSPVRRAWQGVPAAARGKPLCAKGTTPFT
jgi:hypothetical protein